MQFCEDEVLAPLLTIAVSAAKWSVRRGGGRFQGPPPSRGALFWSAEFRNRSCIIEGCRAVGGCLHVLYNPQQLCVIIWSRPGHSVRWCTPPAPPPPPPRPGLGSKDG